VELLISFQNNPRRLFLPASLRFFKQSLINSPNGLIEVSEGTIIPCKIFIFAPKDLATSISGAAQQETPVNGKISPPLVLMGMHG
jgi:hypothetical protein